jgi:hypothetical protein
MKLTIFAPRSPGYRWCAAPGCCRGSTSTPPPPRPPPRCTAACNIAGDEPASLATMMPAIAQATGHPGHGPSPAGFWPQRRSPGRPSPAAAGLQHPGQNRARLDAPGPHLPRRHQPPRPPLRPGSRMSQAAASKARAGMKAKLTSGILLPPWRRWPATRAGIPCQIRLGPGRGEEAGFRPQPGDGRRAGAPCDRHAERAGDLQFATVLVDDLAQHATVDSAGARWSNYEYTATPSALEPRTGWAMAPLLLGSGRSSAATRPVAPAPPSSPCLRFWRQS